MKKQYIAVTVLHVLTALVPLLSGLAFRPDPALGCVGLLVSALFLTALLSRALRIDDECEMMRVALEDPQEAPTDPMIPVAEPVTGVKHKAVSDEPPRITTWHGKRGNG